MKQSSSNRKVNEQAREVIAGILLFEISDPRLELVTITGCEVSYDRSVCNVFYTTEPDRYEDVAAAFQKASGRIRSLMARKLSWRIARESLRPSSATRRATRWRLPPTATCRPTPISWPTARRRLSRHPKANREAPWRSRPRRTPTSAR